MTHPFWTIWFHPRSTIRRILDEGSTPWELLWVGLAGVDRNLDRAMFRSSGDRLPIEQILLGAVVFGPIFGFLIVWFFCFPLSLCGRWLGGDADQRSLRTAVAWSFPPVLLSLPLWLVELWLVGDELFQSEQPMLERDPTLQSLIPAIVVVQLVCWIWSVVLLSFTVAEAQQFDSAWRGFANVLLSIALLSAFAVGIFVAIPLASGG